MPRVFTFHPETLGRGLSLSAVQINGWKRCEKLAIECQGTYSAYVANVEQVKFDMIKRVEWMTPTSRAGEFVHNGVRYNTKLSVTLVAKMLKVSESTAYNMLNTLVFSGFLDRERKGRRYMYWVKM